MDRSQPAVVMDEEEHMGAVAGYGSPSQQVDMEKDWAGALRDSSPQPQHASSSSSSSSPSTSSAPNMLPSTPRSVQVPAASSSSTPSGSRTVDQPSSASGTTASSRPDLHLLRPTASPVLPSVANNRDQVNSVLSLFSSVSSALTSLDSAAQPVTINSEEDLFSAGPDDLSTLDVLEHLHPEDLRSLANTLRLRPTDASLPSSSSPPKDDDGLDEELQPSPTEQSFQPSGSMYGPPPPLLRLQGNVGDAFRREQKRGVKASKVKRQNTQGDGSGPTADGYPTCTQVSNAVLSCYPEDNSTLVQNIWSKFVWNSNYPVWIGTGYVDIYLFNANSETSVANWTRVANDRGMIGIQPQDSWFPDVTSWTDGTNMTIPYFFVMTSAGATLTGGEQHQATFSVVQTAAPTSLVLASLSSVSAAFASSLASLASAGLSGSNSASGSGVNGGAGASSSASALQNNSGGSDFPAWAIALIVVLGVLALLAFLIALYFIFVSARRKRDLNRWSGGAVSGSGGSTSPMIQHEGAALMTTRGGMSEKDMQSPGSSRPGSPLSATSTAMAAGAVGGGAFGALIGARGSDKRDSATGTSDSNEHDAPITSADASKMAEAFRKALRKPEFTSAEPSPGSSKGTVNPPSGMRESMHGEIFGSPGDNGIMQGVEEEEPEAREIMDRELASEGRSMTSIDVRKRPEVHDS